ncbi:unnamed protein product [Macrosiphum euphorbiae]|uniref:Regulatory protein zeste n=1 Tax=Macrosiphum euphorbiae TaxID=13131 RepID=A0AAV0X4Y9_9HEMI|nr:unnamed protein product [Macrosiphum euphorbiae]
MSKDSTEISGRATTDQMIALNGFLKVDPQLLSGKFSSTFTFKIAQKRWEIIAESLNAMPGAVKSWNKWRNTFQDNRTKAKSKHSMIRADMRKTGLNTPCSSLSLIENDTLDLINPTSISGHTSSNASKAYFVFDDNCDLGTQPLDDNIVTVDLSDVLLQEENSIPFGTSSSPLPNPNISSINDPIKSMFKLNFPIRAVVSLTVQFSLNFL